MRLSDNLFVKIQHQLLNHRAKWLRKPLLSGAFGTWLIETGSLTARLQRRYRHFSVKPVRVQYAKPMQNEAVLLRQPSHKTALIREVLLMGNGVPVVFAHSVLPRASLRGAWHGLGRLGNKPLGATLFANPKVKRTPLSYQKLTRNHVLYKHATQHLTQKPTVLNAMVLNVMAQKPSFLWARRSIFSLNCANIMVTEVFLPQLLVKDFV